MAKSAFIHLAVAILLASAAATKKSSFLASRQAHRRASEERLRNSASRLASELGNHLRYRPMFQPMFEGAMPPLPVLAEDARDILRREASRPDAWDGASLLNDYAAMAPDYVLVVPFADGRVDAAPPTNDLVQQMGPTYGHAVSEETTVQSDGDHTISQTTHCKDGDCKTTQSKGLGSPSTQSYHVPALSSMHNTMKRTMEPLHNAMKQMSQDMRDFDSNFGRDPLKESLGSIFHEARGASKSPGTLGSSGSWGSWFNSPFSKDQNSMFKTASSQSSNSQSMSSVTNVENGKSVTRQKICKNGHCKTVVTTEDA